MTLRVGLTLPTFTDTAEPALAAADVAEDGGLDGVFAMHHLWPIGSPGRPALWAFVVLGAVAARTRRVSVGTLVARVGLVDEDTLVQAFETLRHIAGKDRVIAGIGTGDRLSAPENLAYGVPYPPAADRLAELAGVVDRLVDARLTPWIGGTSPETAALARDYGVPRNLWGAPVADVGAAALSPGGPPVTWGGQVLVGRDEREQASLRDRYGTRPGLLDGTVNEIADHLCALADAGATWCVCAPINYADEPRRAAETICQVAEKVT